MWLPRRRGNRVISQSTVFLVSSGPPLLSCRRAFSCSKTLENTRSRPPAAAAAAAYRNYKMSRHPEVKWAERIDKVYITVVLPDSKDAKVNLEPDGVFTFSGTAGTDDNLYELKIDLHDKVNVEASKISIGVRSIFCIVEKAEAKWWKKLVRDGQKAPHFVKIDWDKWVDEDDEDGGDLNLDGMDFSNFGGGDGMDDDLDESDDEEQEVSKPQHAEEADDTKKTVEVEAKLEAAPST